MIQIKLILNVHEEGDLKEIATNIRQNLSDTLSHCPYDVAIECCVAEEVDDVDD